MAVFVLKRGDTRPILEVALKNPDGTALDLTGSTAWKLYVYVSPGRVFIRNMVKQGLDTDGVLRYTWQATDWTDPDALPTPVRLYQTEDLEMEYEVVGGSSRMRFPNDGYDTLRIAGEVVLTESQGTMAATLATLTCVATAS